MIRPARVVAKTEPLWPRRAHAWPALSRDLHVDVAVVGGGISGLTAAWLLKKAGLRVAVLELHRVGAGASGHTSAHLSTLPDRSLSSLVAAHGVERTRDVLRASREAVDFIASTDAALGAGSGFARVPGFHFSERREGADALRAEAELAARLGLEASFATEIPAPFRVRGAVRLEGQGRFEPVRYLEALARDVDGGGSHVFERARAEEIEDGVPCRVGVPPYSVFAGAVIEATHTPLNLNLAVQTRLEPVMTYLLALRTDGALPDALLWDDAEPYHYLREAGGLLLVGGADHKTGEEEDPEGRFSELLAYAGSRFPVVRVERRWSSEIFEPADGLPYIGRDPGKKRVFLAGGFSGTGLTFGTLAGRLLSDLVQGREPEGKELFSPGRIKARASARGALRENLGVAWHLIADRLRREASDGGPPLAPGEGRVLDVDGRKAAVYRDPAGRLHVMSAVCRHAGCIVRWNPAAATWDCPCQGGRYLADGRLLCGPPTQDLRRAPAPEERELGDAAES